MSKVNIILASASPRRRELLKQIGIEFEVIAGNAKEIYSSAEPVEIVKELALLKASDIADRLHVRQGEEYIVLGADTIVVNEDQIMGKPADEEDAFSMISSLSGKKHQVYTGIAFIKITGDGSRSVITHAEKTDVFVRQMSSEEIRAYIATGEPSDKAGAYGIQGRFAAFIDRIEGDYYNVVGLPAAYVYRTLKELISLRHR